MPLPGPVEHFPNMHWTSEKDQGWTNKEVEKYYVSYLIQLCVMMSFSNNISN